MPLEVGAAAGAANVEMICLIINIDIHYLFHIKLFRYSGATNET